MEYYAADKNEIISIYIDREYGRTMHMLWAKFMLYKFYTCVCVCVCTKTPRKKD